MWNVLLTHGGPPDWVRLLVQGKWGSGEGKKKKIVVSLGGGFNKEEVLSETDGKLRERSRQRGDLNREGIISLSLHLRG